MDFKVNGKKYRMNWLNVFLIAVVTFGAVAYAATVAPTFPLREGWTVGRMPYVSAKNTMGQSVVSVNANGDMSGVRNLVATGNMNTTPQAVTVAADGAGTAAAFNLTPTASVILLTCSDTDGCTPTLIETSATSGDRVTIVNMSSNAITFADTSGVSEAAGSFAQGQYDVISYVYATDRWVEVSRSNN